MNIVEEFEEIIKKLDSLDDYKSSLSQKLSVQDTKQEDILHRIEDDSKKIETFGCYRLFKELQKVRIERRKIKNDMAILKTFDDNKNKILTKNNRQFLEKELHLQAKKLDTVYKNRQYNDNELEAIIKGEK